MRKTLKYLLVGLWLCVVAWQTSAQVTQEDASDGAEFTIRSPSTLYDNQAACQSPANLIVAENCLEGTEDWVVADASSDIEGFASAASVNLGETLDFFVTTESPRWDLFIYRNGYYGGKGGRLVHTERDLSGSQQPNCDANYRTGLVTCSNWGVSYSLTIPSDWVSGYYLAKLVNTETGGASFVLFVVRDDARDSDILFQQSTTTMQAYNSWGGKSVYTTQTLSSFYCLTIAEATRAVAVSFNRPQRRDLETNYLKKSGFPMVMWLEGMGYDVTYTTNNDTHQYGKPGAHNELLDHKVFLMVGHDEYWSQEIHDAVQAARDAGVHIGNFSANTSYWRIRFEDDPLTGEADSVMITYKTTESGPPDPSGHATTTWRDPNGVNQPENELLGVMYIGDNDSLYFPLRVSSEQAKDPIYRHTGLQDMPPGTYIDIGRQIVGWEWDAVVENGKTPEGITLLAETPTYGGLLTDAGRYYTLGSASAHAIRYTAPSGAIVFSSGTNLWSWGLELVEPDRRLQQITYNLLSDMGVQPVTPPDTLILDGQTDADPPDYSADFRNVGEGNAPVISNVTVTASETEVTVTWETDKPATSQLWLRSANTDWRLRFPLNQLIIPRATDLAYTTVHTLTGSNLDRNIPYEYAVASVDAEGRTTISPIGTFTTESGGINARIYDLLRPPYRSVQCWAAENKTAAIGIGVAAVAVVGIGLWRGLVFLRRRRRRA